VSFFVSYLFLFIELLGFATFAVLGSSFVTLLSFAGSGELLGTGCVGGAAFDSEQPISYALKFIV